MISLIPSILAIKTALEELGIREVYHMTTVMKNPKDAEMWSAAINAKFCNKGKKFTRKEWDALLGSCEVRCCSPLMVLVADIGNRHASMSPQPLSCPSSSKRIPRLK